MFPALPFERLNEADVREEVIAPMLRQLGYRSGTANDVIREQSLRYPRVFLGRKDPKRDPILRGKADYILEVDGRLRWVIEAKAPGVEIDVDCIEQAWTYSNHAEVRAVYFAVSNGRELRVFRTNDAPTVGAILTLSYEELSTRFYSLESLLSPEALLRDFQKFELDIGAPIASGLRSIARIANGAIRYRRTVPAIGFLKELQFGIASGAIERDERGKLVAFYKVTVPSRSLQELNERLGFSHLEMASDDSRLSEDARFPTVFQYQNTIVLPKGVEVLDMSTWQRVTLPHDITCDVRTIARGSYKARRFAGDFAARLRYREFGFDLTLEGVFETDVA